tara:strand:+ start:1266 stop:1541 length:276 start_codon:yes stop_codon:yes gene_type:complete
MSDSLVVAYVLFVLFLGCCMAWCSIKRICNILEFCVEIYEDKMEQRSRRKLQRCTIIFPVLPNATPVSSPYIISLEYANAIPDAIIIEEDI